MSRDRTKSPKPIKSVVLKSTKPTGSDKQASRGNIKWVIADATDKFLRKYKVPLKLETITDLQRGISLVFTVTDPTPYGATQERQKIACVQALIHLDDYDSPYPHLTGELGLNEKGYEISFDPDPLKPAGISTLRLNIFDSAAGAAVAMLNVFTCRNYLVPVVFCAVACAISLSFFYFR